MSGGGTMKQIRELPRSSGRTAGRQRPAVFGAVILLSVAVLFACVAPAGADEMPPSLGASVAGQITLADWPARSTVRVTVDDDLNPGNGVLATGELVIGADGWKNAEVLGGTKLASVLQVGRYVTAKRGTTTQTLHLEPLTVTSVDPATNVVTGTTIANAALYVSAFNANGGDWLIDTESGDSGQWLANFTSKHDLVAGDSGEVALFDEDLNWTFTEWRIPKPGVFASVMSNDICVDDWPVGSVVRVTVDADENPANGSLYSEDVTAAAGELVWCDSEKIAASGGLRAGQYVRATQGTTTKVLFITDLDVASVDTASDTVRGTAPPGTHVEVWGDVRGGAEANTTAGGTWSARVRDANIVAGDAGTAGATDSDGDATWAFWRATGVSIKAASAKVKRGKSVMLSGRTTPASELATESIRVEIRKPGKGWTLVADVVLAANGSWKYAYAVPKNAKPGSYYFRAIRSRHGETMGSTSSAVKVIVLR